MLRLTEVEVHGTDLDLGLAAWSDTFAEDALPFRLSWLPRRRSNHRTVDPDITGSWLLVADEGDAWRLATNGTAVTCERAEPTATADAVIEGPARELLALLLGRAAPGLRHGGDLHLAAAFSRAFPGP